MNRKKRYQDLLEQISQAHQQYARFYESFHAAEVKKYGTNWEKKICEINRNADGAAVEHSKKRDELVSILTKDLMSKSFLQSEADSVDAVIDFLEVKTVSYHSYWLKEWCLRKLKKISLNQQHEQRLKALAIDWITRNESGLRLFARLMIKLADDTFTQKLKELAFQESDDQAAKKARLMLKIVLNSRTDLRQSMPAK